MQIRDTAKFITIIFLLLAMLYGLWTYSYAEIPRLINYQGRLTDSSGKPLDGTYKLNFKIYNNAGTLLWQGTHNSVLVQKGVFSVLLGDANDAPYNFSQLAFDEPYFLEIKVCKMEGANEICEVLSPRQQITSAAYAIRAEHGVPKGVIVMWSGRILDIPSGWALCDGTNGTPDLRDKFIVGARQDDGGVAKTNVTGSLTQSGGSTSIEIANLPPHDHGSTGAHTHTESGYVTDAGGSGFSEGSGQIFGTAVTSSNGVHTHSSVGSGSPYTQPYYVLAYIMKL